MQRRRHALDAFILGKEMPGAAHGERGNLPSKTLAHARRRKCRRIDTAQHRLTESVCHGGHVAGDGGIVRREIVVARVRVHGAENIAVRGKIKGKARNVRMLRVGKVDFRNAAEGARRLIHETARLAEIVSFGALRNAGECERVHGAAVIKRGKNRADEIFKRC